MAEESASPLQFLVEDIESVPEPLREHYAENDDGKHVLQFEGQTPAEIKATEKLREVEAKVSEFRDTNTKVLKENADLKSKAEKAKKLADSASRTGQSVNQEAQEKIEELTKRLDERDRQLRDRDFAEVVRKEAGKVGVLEGAMTDVLNRARGSGLEIDMDSGEVEGVKGFLTNLKKEAKFLFVPSNGDAGGSKTGKSSGPTVEQWFDEDWRQKNRSKILSGEISMPG